MWAEILSIYIGCKHKACDHLCAQVRTRDQMLPMHVLHVAGHVPGLPGLFMAGVFSGSLSTISSGLNSLAAIALRDFLPRARLGKLTSLQQVTVLRGISNLIIHKVHNVERKCNNQGHLHSKIKKHASASF